MGFTRTDHWVWDFWHANDGVEDFLYYLHAPKSLLDPHLRHRNARIGVATSADLQRWVDHGVVLEPGGTADFDGSATWTGSVVQDDDGSWHMFYTGTRFLSADTVTNVETVGRAVSTDLVSWTKQTGSLSADPRWYETLADDTWHEEAWRDPWIHRDSAGLWHMLLTARSRAGSGRDRGVIGHATSTDLQHWTVQPPLSEPGAGFAHLEVIQLVTIDDRPVLLFSCDTAHLAGQRKADGVQGGIWALPLDTDVLDGPLDVASAVQLTTEDLYAGRAVRTRTGEWALLAFENVDSEGTFIGGISDPLPLEWAPNGSLSFARTEVSA
ncbi:MULTISPECIES: glycosyl hydrolase family 32 [unclassified Arthrobacter]|uniref:glycosyl hydrolase family 32 n=1 Tax=unclassified Arthrobacter TaxID=235627 RepID=UPI001E61C96D|nr:MULTISPECIES: glycosyl hydrolase family 32 [unclassified Arthrobacter]MCC9145934.1 glycosyl hydrolase family 32 [Arthrobacter sp. zg-Y919]MDK1277163.1 glycosyl hydrolase family 32 [Arthrobacter sp. zg.Y919]WIB03680.1 glycosyl hydrolase family 32 [Arthrobacter sp. zg-Y919]